ncbi:hypothetical protein [Roseovarius aestuarii]|uniref:hypothetical protein n=1 Tax=Roseovarius aestuarii TaxID=475083 RepID=UPI001CC0B431|nr:hypothetical protein [Roseovarius aestuarii]
MAHSMSVEQEPPTSSAKGHAAITQPSKSIVNEVAKYQRFGATLKKLKTMYCTGGDFGRAIRQDKQPDCF